jgi:hypothetical protein
MNVIKELSLFLLNRIYIEVEFCKNKNVFNYVCIASFISPYMKFRHSLTNNVGQIYTWKSWVIAWDFRGCKPCFIT